MTADPKPKRRTKNPNAGRAKVLAEGHCRACGRRPSGHPLDSLNRMHLVNKSQGGDDVDDNIVPGCGSGTTGCHGILTEHQRGWESVAAQLRANLTAREIAYVVSKKGKPWLDDNYPVAA